MSNSIVHELKLLIVVLVWGINYKLIKFGLAEFGVSAFTFLRFAAAMPLLLLVLAFTPHKQLERSDIPRLILVGFVGTTAYQAVFALGVSLTSASNAAVLFSLSPVFAFLLAALLGKDKPTLLNWLGLAIAFAGALLVITKGQVAAVSITGRSGDLAMLGAAALWALYSFFAEPLTKKYGGLAVTAWSFIPGLFGLALVSSPHIVAIAWSRMSLPAWLSLLYAVLFVTAIGLVFFYQAIPHIGPQRVMSYMFLVPVVAILFASLYFQESLVPAQAAGSLIVFLGVYLARKKKVIPR